MVWCDITWCGVRLFPIKGRQIIFSEMQTVKYHNSYISYLIFFVFLFSNNTNNIL